MTMNTAIRTRDLTKTYDITVLDHVDLDVFEGQFVAIMGPSGSGKSTLLHCISGMDRPTSGTVVLADTEITALDERQLAALRLAKLGFVFQQAHLMTTLNLLDNIVLPGFLAGLRPRPEITAHGTELMRRMGIEHLAGSDVTEVSGGQLQRAGICRALINNPAIIFADEPTGALNSATAAQILDLLGEIHAAGTTLIVVTHDTQVAARADRVLLLVDGRIVEDLDLGRYDADAASIRVSQVTEALNRRCV
ncbi:ABC transporter ATP-binding protein [Corynebacterium canis]|uniref:ABC transporter ATP-binding protein n=2 Tax=Corynebacterium canis TaxID=679663 RepID=A0A5C5UAB6_9CORY|nr:ABC transporter ATP-binding protein [Corynebacterium canis]WJY74687.1 Lipoprotein-releasing system ATP-binding protein LolD [Corynebacterium canis]